MEAKSQLLSKVETMQFVLPEHLNHMEMMHGGEILKLMDDTAGLAFMRYCEGDAVTAGVSDVKFIRSIPSKSMIKCTAQIIATGRTSMKTKVEIYIEDIKLQVSHKAVEGIFVGVAVDEEGKPRPVSPILQE